MAKPNKYFPSKQPGPQRQQKRMVESLLDAMVDGKEYQSLLNVTPNNIEFGSELRRAIKDIEDIRKRPLVVYAGNVIKPLGNNEISYPDDLPFSEMISAVPTTDSLDVLIVTPGGLAQQVSQFVNKVRPRFTNVSMILPYMAMSAGTIWALSGNDILMDQRAFIGPIDPQVVGKDGRFVPAQAILMLLKRIQESGEENMKKGLSPDWSDRLILQNIDAKEIGNALSQSQYSIQLATEYLKKYKFRDWKIHGDGTPVTTGEVVTAATEIARKLCSHEYWKVHSNGISREVAWDELKIKIDHPEATPGLERAIRRFWALLYWLFDNTPLVKLFLSQQYTLFKTSPTPKQ
ncbi:MAG: hypothetical protein Q7J73_01300 [Dehalococcoidales bacterium]|nr:hypothetical protein [Dehalococcoidales bacterium]